MTVIKSKIVIGGACSTHGRD